jgi:hypothetical protein
MFWRIAGVLVLLAAAAGVLAVRSGLLTIPERFNPWAELDVNAPPNFLTRFKLARLTNDETLCRKVLASTHLDYERLSDRSTGPRCGLRNAVRIDRTASEVTEAFSLSCRAAVSLALWETHVLRPAAREHLGGDVERLEHFGSYSCRNVYGRPSGRRSQHATADALDVAGFVLSGGRRVRVLRDWGEDSAESAFLHEVRDGACFYFDAVLSPDYNDAHRDHLHVDRGAYRVCR